MLEVPLNIDVVIRPVRSIDSRTVWTYSSKIMH